MKGYGKKLKLLVAEYHAGNTTTRNEIVAVLDELRSRNAIDEKEYVAYNNDLGGDSSKNKLCIKFLDRLREWNKGDYTHHKELCDIMKKFGDIGITTPEISDFYLDHFEGSLIDRLKELGDKYEPGDKKTAREIEKCAKALRDQGTCTEENYKQLKCSLEQ